MTHDVGVPGPAGPRPPLDAAAVAAAARRSGTSGRVLLVGRTASTSADLLAGLAGDPEAWPDRSVLVADHQDGGRGRRGRTWTTPARAALTTSVVLRPSDDVVPVAAWGWLPLLAGLAVVDAVEVTTGLRAVLKWPNDVLLDGAGTPLEGWGARRKVAGVLGDLAVVPGGRAAVVGIGVNVDQGPEELPVPSATSLRVAGARVDRTVLLEALLTGLWDLDRRWRAAGGDAVAAGLHGQVTAVCATLGEPVRVDLPGGAHLDGVARGLGPDGSLEVVDGGGAVRTVLAGDVHHMRLRP